jgi:hypothetical protein
MKKKRILTAVSNLTFNTGEIFNLISSSRTFLKFQNAQNSAYFFTKFPITKSVDRDFIFSVVLIEYLLVM